MNLDAALAGALIELEALEGQDRMYVLRGLTAPQARLLLQYWEGWAHPGQKAPGGDWRVWMILAGRGFGKTRAGAEWVSDLARRHGGLKIALVGGTVDEVANVMIRGTSGLMAVSWDEEDVIYVPATRTVTFTSGAQAFVYSGEKPDKLRGPEHHIAWADELAKWRRPEETWTNLMLGLRLKLPAGEGDPRALVTTTPRSIALVKALAADPQTVVLRGGTRDNPHVAEAFVKDVTARYGGTRLGRQELDGELIEDVEGALWTRDLVEKCRVPILPGTGRDRFVRIVIGVDPPVSAGGDACGIVACALNPDGVGHVIADHSVAGMTPEGWARCVAAAAEAHGADWVVAEANQGGEMVESVLRAADCALPVKLVHARRGKSARAEPVAALFESGRAKFAGAFPNLEDELCGLQAGGGYAGPGRSPDRADAMVWAMTELMLGRSGAPAVRGL